MMPERSMTPHFGHTDFFDAFTESSQQVPHPLQRTSRYGESQVQDLHLGHLAGRSDVVFQRWPHLKHSTVARRLSSHREERQAGHVAGVWCPGLTFQVWPHSLHTLMRLSPGSIPPTLPLPWIIRSSFFIPKCKSHSSTSIAPSRIIHPSSGSVFI